MPTEEILLRVVPGTPVVEFGAPFPLDVVRAWEDGATPEPWRDDVLVPLVVDAVATTTRSGDGRVEERRRFRARAFTLEDATVAPPPFEVSFGGGRTASATVAPVTIVVRPSLDRRDPGPPELPGGMLRERPTTLLVAALSALAIAAVVALRAARRRRIPTPEADAPTVPVEPPPGPDAVALARLAELRARDVRTAAESLAFHVDAAVALREYVHGRFAVRTTERTTEEVVAALAAVPARDRAGAEGAFAACDLVKFAAHAASPAERNALLDAAARFVRTTSPPAHRGSADA